MRSRRGNGGDCGSGSGRGGWQEYRIKFLPVGRYYHLLLGLLLTLSLSLNWMLMLLQVPILMHLLLVLWLMVLLLRLSILDLDHVQCFNILLDSLDLIQAKNEVNVCASNDCLVA